MAIRIVNYCPVCNSDTVHINGNCQPCKSKAFHKRKAEVKLGTMCHKMVTLEETIYDLKKEIIHGRPA